MNLLPKQALLREDTASLLSGGLGVSHRGGHPHSSPVALKAITLAHLLSYREVLCTNSILGGGGF